MATDKLINMDQGDDIIDALSDIATNINTITYGPQTSADKVVSMTGYQKSSATDPGAISQGDTLNEAVGKLEKRVDNTATAIADKIESYTDATTSGHVVTFNNSTGTQVTDSGVSIATSTTGVTDVDTTIPTSKSVVAYAATKDHTHNYAGSSSAGGAATSADKLNIGSSNIGSATQPVYFDKTTGKPVAITNTIQSNVPANAVFTDTTYTVAEGTANGKIKVTPSSGTAYEVPVHGLGNAAYKGVATSVSTSEDLVTSKAVNTKLASYVPNSDFVVVENNIVYALGKTGRNQFNIDMTTLKYWNTAGTWNGNVYTQGGLTFTFNNDGTIDVSGTATERVNIVLDVYYPLNTESGYRFHDLDGLVLSGCPTGGAWNKYSLSLQMTDSPWASAAQDTGSGAIIDKSVLPSNVTTVAFYLSIYASYPTSSLTFKPMFCTQEDWSVTHDYTPYQGKSNYDLTQLQSEDRASLVEIVDSGAKNLLNPVNVTEGTNAAWNSTTGTATQTATDTKTWLDMRVKFYNNTTYVYTIPSEPVYVKQNGLWYIEFAKNSTFNILRVGHNGSDQDFNILINVSNLENGKNYVFSCNILQCVQASGFYSFNQLMICTEATFAVSKAFAPHRYDPYTTVYQNVRDTTLYARRNGRTVTVNGYVDNISLTAGDNTILGTINDEIGKPLQQVRSICSVGANAYTFGEPAYLAIAPDGNVVVTPKTYSGTGAVFFSVSYTI